MQMMNDEERLRCTCVDMVDGDGCNERFACRPCILNSVYDSTGFYAVV